MDAGLVAKLEYGLDISPLLAGLLVRLGLSEVEAARQFLHPRLAQLDDPFKITHMDKLVDRLLLAMQEGERIAIVGDYDVDGVTSVTLLVSIAMAMMTALIQVTIPQTRWKIQTTV